MANQVDPATVGGAASPGAHGETGHSTVSHSSLPATTNVAQLGPFPPYHGRRVSWVAVSVISVGFLVGGLSLIFGSHGPTWWLFWVGGGLSVVGVLMTLATNTFEDWY